MPEKIIEPLNDAVAQEDEKLKEEGLLRELSERRHALYDADEANDSFVFLEQVNVFIKKLQTFFPDYEKYKLYHLLASSGIFTGEEGLKFDFPGEYSVERFLKMSDEERKKFISQLSVADGKRE